MLKYIDFIGQYVTKQLVYEFEYHRTCRTAYLTIKKSQLCPQMPKLINNIVVWLDKKEIGKTMNHIETKAGQHVKVQFVKSLNKCTQYLSKSNGTNVSRYHFKCNIIIEF